MLYSSHKYPVSLLLPKPYPPPAFPSDPSPLFSSSSDPHTDPVADSYRRPLPHPQREDRLPPLRRSWWCRRGGRRATPPWPACSLPTSQDSSGRKGSGVKLAPESGAAGQRRALCVSHRHSPRPTPAPWPSSALGSARPRRRWTAPVPRPLRRRAALRLLPARRRPAQVLRRRPRVPCVYSRIHLDWILGCRIRGRKIHASNTAHRLRRIHTVICRLATRPGQALSLMRSSFRYIDLFTCRNASQVC